MARHKIQITYDEAAGSLSVTHRTAVEVGGHAVSVAEPVALADEAGAVAALQALIAGNRAEMEKRAERAGIEHAAAVGGKAKGKRVALGGSLGAIGGGEAKKLP